MTADVTPERAADELAAVSQEPGRGDDRPGIDVTGDVDPADVREIPDVEPGPFVAPFRELIHNISQFGRWWSWRCGVAYSTLDPGYIDGACRYDHTVDSWAQLVADATEHLRRWHDIHPAPTAREIPDGELAEAERCGICALPIPPDGWVLDERDQHVHEACLLAAALDELRRERDAARAEIHEIGLALGLRPAPRVRLDGDAVRDRASGVIAERDAARAEVERLRTRAEALSRMLRESARQMVGHRIEARGWRELLSEESAEVERLRAVEQRSEAITRAAGQLLLLVDELDARTSAMERAATALRVALPGRADSREETP